MDARLRDAVTRLEQGYGLVYGLVYERSVAAMGEVNVLKSSEFSWTRPQVARHD